jgi:mannose-1-phosphate guanylyltransferase/mannose-6-phosphate isomerase
MMPKQLLKITSAERSMFQLTLQRTVGVVSPERIWIVTVEAQRVDIERELAACGMEGARILCEPVGRNTAPAIALAVQCIRAVDPQAAVAVFPADHHIEGEGRFLDLVHRAAEVALKGWLVTMGIKPHRPETGYGYINMGPPLEEFPGRGDLPQVHRAVEFTEKPDLSLAQEYLRKGTYFWNSGIFIWSADTFLEEMSKYLPTHHRTIEEIVQRLGANLVWDQQTRAIYHALEPISVDYGILERSDRVAMIPADIRWSDVGSWAALWEIMPKDERENVVHGDIIATDTERCLIRSEERLVAALGLRDMVLVDTPDAMLVCPRERSQEVREIVEKLLETGRQEAVIHKEVLKPWGAYRVLWVDKGFQVKWLEILPSHRLSLQSHRHRMEHWVVVRGEATVTLGEEIVELGPGQHVLIPYGAKHRVENRSSAPLRIIEVQLGDYLGEDDIVRYEDDYGRTNDFNQSPPGK